MIHEAMNYYIHFVMFAVLGRMAEADGLMRSHGRTIRTIASALGKAPIEIRPVYRGLLLDPTKPYRRDERLTFLSWSEDRDVARWFASRQSYVSEPLVQSNPKLRGYLARLEEPQRVLFHHAWINSTHLATLAAMHPQMGAEGARQITWSLATQAEIITEPLDLEPEPIEEPDDIDDLDRRLSPWWLVEKETPLERP